MVSVISAIRAFKTERKLSMSAEIGDITIGGNEQVIRHNAEIIRISMNTGNIAAAGSQAIEVREAK